ncbi:hypothetical protein BG844_21220 [Couchioplanes caeruleus subsp. caeruleus]|uniref:Uncharacterized protein n=1 Tax=Couchioplanes caeruleus subsp. caeruleus TaxID=56427 RepID=A0A1K0G4Y3_9ACTN|nr:hypothetical protein BG844_21220 [Couchioplanes caeruleus subsp. caeruleus]
MPAQFAGPHHPHGSGQPWPGHPGGPPPVPLTPVPRVMAGQIVCVLLAIAILVLILVPSSSRYFLPGPGRYFVPDA